MRDLVFVKFNSKLKQKRENKLRDPIEKQVADILEEDSNEWITGVAANIEQSQDHEAVGAKEQDGTLAGKGKRMRVGRPRKRTRRIIDITEGNEDEPEAASSSDTEDEHDVDMAEDSDHSSSSNDSMFDE